LLNFQGIKNGSFLWISIKFDEDFLFEECFFKEIFQQFIFYRVFYFDNRDALSVLNKSNIYLIQNRKYTLVSVIIMTDCG